MRILMVSEFFPTGRDLKFSGGVEARNYFIAKYLAKQHRITILTTRLFKSPRRERIANFDVIRVGQPQKYLATTSGLISRISFIKNSIIEAMQIRADILDGSNFISHVIVLLISKIKRTPAVLWYPDVWLGSWYQNAGIVGIFGEILERINLKLGASAYIAISKVTYRKLKKYTESKIQIIPCGVDLKEFKNFKKKKNIILCVSRLAKYKNIDDLILAFSKVKKSHKDLKLMIVGQGPQKANLQKLVTSLKLKKHVIFLSILKRSQLTTLFKSAKIFCLPSAVEGFGISIIEAAAAGTPYVVSDVSVFKEITKNGQGGLLFNLNDTDDLALKLEKLLKNQTLYNTKSRQALNLSQNYQWSQIAQQTESLYKAVFVKNQ